ncbi:MAG TPA: serine/threonine-protein kinase [Nannocystis sp.]
MSAVPTQIGPYKVKGLVGKGAMGEVYEGIDAGLNRRVAIKILGKKHRESEEFKTRFLREGKALAQMNHPNVVGVYFIGEHEDRPFLAMEFLDGEDIGAMLKRRGALHPGDAAEVIRQAAIGLAETQRVGVVHRDVKPSNLVVTSSGIVKVTDFGLAKALQEDLSITATGVFVGTPDYLAPEQAMGKEVDARADVYALGCSLFHMCSGHPPFRKGGQDDHYTAVVRRHLRAERPELKYEIKGFDEALSDLCRRMMSRRPDVRPTFEELKVQLTEISKRLGGQVPPRHADVELRTPEEINEKIRQDQKKQPAPAAGDAPGGSTTRSTVIAVGIGITIGIALGVVFAVMSM